MQINNYLINQDIYNKFQPKRLYSPAQFNTQSTNTVQVDKSKEKIDWRVLGGAALGTLIPMLLISKCKNKDLKFWNIDYKLPQMILLSLGSISGGLAGGIIGNKCPDSRKEKIKESLYQSINAILPASFVTGAVKLAGNNNILKVAGTIAAIGIGMPLAAVLSDRINNNFIDKEHPTKRKIKIQDCLIHVDDLIVAITLLNLEQLKGLPLQKILPLLYANCGYEAGSK